LNQDYCFAVTAKKMNLNTKAQDYDVEFDFSFNKGFIPDSSPPNYNEYVYAPDLDSWDKWLSTGSVTILPYLNEFIAREISF